MGGGGEIGGRGGGAENSHIDRKSSYYFILSKKFRLHLPASLFAIVIFVSHLTLILPFESVFGSQFF